MRKLGAILAGGKSTRFGSDKAAAMLNGRPLIDHVAEALSAQVDAVIICGRVWPGMQCMADRPHADMGPLGGLNAALHFARDNGFGHVLSAGCDMLPIPKMPAPEDPEKACFVDGHYLFGLWPVSLAATLDRHLDQQSNHSMRHWVDTIAAQAVPATSVHANFNTPADLEEYDCKLAGQG